MKQQMFWLRIYYTWLNEFVAIFCANINNQANATNEILSMQIDENAYSHFGFIDNFI